MIEYKQTLVYKEILVQYLLEAQNEGWSLMVGGIVPFTEFQVYLIFQREKPTETKVEPKPVTKHRVPKGSKSKAVPPVEGGLPVSDSK